jgi:TMEM175 potassium channel family protein
MPAETDAAASDARPALRGGRRALAALASFWSGGLRPVTVARAGHLEYDRILFFSDAVFAIAITLLIVDLPSQLLSAADSHTQVQSGQVLRQSEPGIIGFGISFAVIGLFWVGHHGLFRYIKSIDRRLMLLNLLFVGIIAFLPFPTAVLSATSSSQVPAVVFYAVCSGTAGTIELVMWLYATRSRAGLEVDASPEIRSLLTLQCARGPVVFAVSIMIAVWWSPVVATYSWIGVAVTGGLINRFYGHHEGADDPRAPADAGDAADPVLRPRATAAAAAPEPPSPSEPDGESG